MLSARGDEARNPRVRYCVPGTPTAGLEDLRAELEHLRAEVKNPVRKVHRRGKGDLKDSAQGRSRPRGCWRMQRADTNRVKDAAPEPRERVQAVVG